MKLEFLIYSVEWVKLGSNPNKSRITRKSEFLGIIMETKC